MMSVRKRREPARKRSFSITFEGSNCSQIAELALGQRFHCLVPRSSQGILARYGGHHVSLGQGQVVEGQSTRTYGVRSVFT